MIKDPKFLKVQIFDSVAKWLTVTPGINILAGSGLNERVNLSFKSPTALSLQPGDSEDINKPSPAAHG